MADKTLSYHISVENPLSRFVQFTLNIEGLAEPVTRLWLPVWRPGRYQVQNFTQNIFSFTPFTENGEKLNYTKPTKDCWEIENGEARSIQLRYTFLARQLDAGGSWSDEHQLYLNFINCAFRVEGFEQTPYRVTLDVPKHYQLAVPLPNKAFTFTAQNFDELVDTPLIASEQLQCRSFSFEETEFYIWINGIVDPDWDKIIDDFKRFTEQQYLVFGDFPHPKYHYLFQITPTKSYHGVEHATSTVITLGPDYQFAERELYKNFIGIASHELVHVWNVKAIRPVELLPYNYQKENSFDTGWVLEGITTYYGDLMMARGGATTVAEYLAELSKDAQRHFDNEGRQVQPLSESSVDLWVDGYDRSFPNRSVSIYVKGSLVALLLDFTLRAESDHAITLDTLMKELWQRFGKTNTGYRQSDIEDLLLELTDKDWKPFFDRFVRGTEALEEPLQAVLNTFGLVLNFEEEDSQMAARFGLVTQLKENIATVQRLAEGSPAAKRLSLGDEIIAINGRKITASSKDFSLFMGKESIRLSFFRQGILKEAELNYEEGNTYFKAVSISKIEKPTEAQANNLLKWLRQA